MLHNVLAVSSIAVVCCASLVVCVMCYQCASFISIPSDPCFFQDEGDIIFKQCPPNEAGREAIGCFIDVRVNCSVRMGWLGGDDQTYYNVPRVIRGCRYTLTPSTQQCRPSAATRFTRYKHWGKDVPFLDVTAMSELRFYCECADSECNRKNEFVYNCKDISPEERYADDFGKVRKGQTSFKSLPMRNHSGGLLSKTWILCFVLSAFVLRQI